MSLAILGWPGAIQRYIITNCAHPSRDASEEIIDFRGNFISVSETEILTYGVSKSNNELEARLKLARAHKITFCSFFTCKIWDFLCFRAKLERLYLPLEQREILAHERALFLTLAGRRCSIIWRFLGRFLQITRGFNRKIEKMHRANYFRSLNS